MTLQDRLAEIDEGALDVHRSYRQLIDELVLENKALRQEIGLLEARLDERRQMEPTPQDVRAAYQKVDKPCARCEGWMTKVWPNRKYCDTCLSERKRELMQARQDAGEFTGPGLKN